MTKPRGPVYSHDEASWGAPVRREAKRGSHLTFEVPLRWRGKLVGLLLREGVHGGDPAKLYFPHDLPRVGETVDASVSRIVKAACGARVTTIRHMGIESWADDDGHWHICPTMAATIRALPAPGGNVRAVLAFDRDSIPSQPFAWWTAKDLVWLMDELDHAERPRTPRRRTASRKTR
jgi:ADP-ribose pyrophosphatase YjhB (NUDIX family)